MSQPDQGWASRLIVLQPWGHARTSRHPQGTLVRGDTIEKPHIVPCAGWPIGFC